MVSTTARVSSIDIGTNSVRVLVAELEGPSGLKRLWGDRAIPRLGSGLGSSGMLTEQAVERTITIVGNFLEKARALSAQKLLAAATSAVREASNRELLLERLEQTTGLRARVLSGQEEALWTMGGMQCVWEKPPEEWLAVDIGGGSTEFILARGSRALEVRSVPLGMVKLTEEFLKGDPPSEKEMGRCRDSVRKSLQEALGDLGLHQMPQLAVAGTAGTITTLAALEKGMKYYDGEAIHGTRLERYTVRRWLSRLSSMEARDRRSLPGMEPGREDVIVAGVLIVEEFLNMVGVEAMVVSDHGLLEGIARMAPLLGQPLT
jgi:exopolyphosphatase/guanosine-5'-triphosphate,3'-diphosphate pyrophosphatase